ncbi:antirestriction protein ArdC [Sphingomonas kyeonggiensis]|uniref:Antirestriction protein ArdC n=1 Tax=Sphingomonas kyeonggiensis TaxID=1268553 RepID=A0A7W7NQX1_9SPHN|nr:zincin-like metallopeptidase domain-containing protein [Sphingomonas kyeonggiensis]MBB4837004.1 antirestriction protein ArdC [Sphingomonas kyeonggiensis]
METTRTNRESLYAEVTARVIAELEQGRLPWVQPWDSAACGCTMPHNAGTGRRYSGINVLILWAAVIEGGYASQRWLTYRQANALGGNVRKGERGTTICYADRFTPKDEAERARSEDREARQLAFLKRFTVFNIDQCEGLPDKVTALPAMATERETIPLAEAVIAATGADFRIGGSEAYYSPPHDYVQVPPQAAFPAPINWYRTALHELGHWTGHASRLDRNQRGGFGSADYAREELVAEMASAFTCASLSISPTVRHSDYIGAWLAVLREDEKAIFRAASAASKAADYLLGFVQAEPDQRQQ